MKLSIEEKKKSGSSSFVEILRKRAENIPNQLAFIYLNFNGDADPVENRITYRELDEKAQAIAANFQAHHAFGERAMLLYPPGLDYIAAYLGCLYAGVIAVPAYPPTASIHMQRLDLIAEDSQSKFALSISPIVNLLLPKIKPDSILHTLNWVSTDDLRVQQEFCLEHDLINRDTTAFLQYTSGSTSVPKGVIVSHGNLLENLFLIDKYYGHHKNSQGVIWLPPYHDMGLIGGILQPIYAGFPCTLMSPVDFIQKPYRWLRAVSDYGGTTSGGINFAFDLCLRKITDEQVKSLNLESWDLAFIGADFINPDTLLQFADKFSSRGFNYEAFYPCYGLAESTLFVSGGNKYHDPIFGCFDQTRLKQRRIQTLSNEDLKSQKLVSCGQPLQDVQIQIVDPESKTICPPDQTGEIWVSSDSVAKGYWNWSREKSGQIFQAFTSCGQGPFLRTGDLGFFYQKELYLTGRIKNLIIINGKNYYSQDIERSAEQSHEALRAGFGAAFSVSDKGEKQLVIVMEVNRQYLRKLNGTEVAIEMFKSVLKEHFIKLTEVVLIKTGSIPKTSSGKIQNFKCREQYLSKELNVVYAHKFDHTLEPPTDDSVLTAGNETDQAIPEAFKKKSNQNLGLNENVSKKEQQLIDELLDQLQHDCLLTVAGILKLKPSDISLDSDLVETGLGSVDVVDLSNQISSTFQIEVAPNFFYKFPSIRLFSEHLIGQHYNMIRTFYLGKSWADSEVTLEKVPDPNYLELVDSRSDVNRMDKTELFTIIDIEKRLSGEHHLDNYISRQKQKKRLHKSKNSLLRHYLDSLLDKKDNQVRLLVGNAANQKTEIITGGQGSPVVLIPGFCMTAPVWFFQMQAWSSTHQVIVIHLPEHGFSQKLARCSLEAMADNIVEVLNSLGIDLGFHIVGNSLGGLVGQTLAARHPKSVRSLTLTGCGYEIRSKNYDTESIEESLSNFTRSCWQDIENVMQCTDSESILDNRDSYLKLLSTAQVIEHEAARRYMIQFQYFSTLDLLSTIRCPTLIVTGKQDEFKKYQYNPKEVQTLYANIQDCQYLEFLQAGHFPFLTHYKEFNKEVMSFMSAQEVKKHQSKELIHN